MTISDHVSSRPPPLKTRSIGTKRPSAELVSSTPGRSCVIPPLRVEAIQLAKLSLVAPIPQWMQDRPVVDVSGFRTHHEAVQTASEIHQMLGGNGDTSLSVRTGDGSTLRVTPCSEGSEARNYIRIAVDAKGEAALIAYASRAQIASRAALRTRKYYSTTSNQFAR